MENNQNHNPHPNLDNHHHPWDTKEDLLLAFAVERHGFNDWDNVAMELQSRINRRLFTAHHCQERFHDLDRRFGDQCNGAAASDHVVPWREEVRKLRCAELRRDVQRHDVNIQSWEKEVKRLQELNEKEKNAKEDEKPDPAVSGEKRLLENDKGGEQEVAGPVNSEPEDKLLPTAGEESDRENQSVNESNSTDSRFEVAKTGEGDVKLGPGPAPVQSGQNEPDPVRKRKPVGEESNNGSYDTEAKVPTCESVPPSEERKAAAEEGSSELNDSVAAHSGDGGGTRESSDVQSSASLTRRRKTQRRKEVSGGGEVAMVKSEPLVGVWELIKGHENISLFERRLENQEDSDRYKETVRQHVDLETIQLRLQKGSYSSCTSAFFRDLLLLFTNATVFFPEGSTESRAAQQLHHIVISEMRSHGQSQSDPSPQKSDSLPPNAPPAKPDSLLSKHQASAPILVCRKRSSISAKASPATSGQKSDTQTIANDKKEKPPSDAKPPLKPSNSETDEEEAPKTKEKPVTTGARSLRRSNKNLNTNTSNKKPSSNSTTKGGSSTSKSTETLKLEKSKAEPVPEKKRNAAADFLKRIKRNTSVEALKSGAAAGGGSNSSSKGGGGGVKEQKKPVNSAKGDKGKEKASRNNNEGGPGSGDKRSKNTAENSKRSVGRPPKKAAETTPVSAKRGRESGASGGKDKRPKKRSKK